MPNGLAVRDDIMALENWMKESPDQLSLDELGHHFAPGIYARTVFVPAGTLLTGKVHRKAHLNVLLQGHCVVSSAGEKKHLKAPHIFMSPAGTKKARYAIEDCLLMTIHPTDETDLDKLEEQLVCDSYEDFDRKRIEQ